MKAFFLSAALIFAAATPSFACTPEELTAKATDVSQKLQEMMAMDAQKANAILEKVTAKQSQMMKPDMMMDVEDACKFYDEILADLG